MRQADAHREAIAKATECHEELGLDPFARVDPFAGIAQLGMKLHFRPLTSCAALYVPGSRAAGKPGVLVNSQHPLALQRYSASHELGHHRFDHGMKIDREGEMRLETRASAPEERLAEAFAGWFLMPPELADVIFEDVLQVDRARQAQDVYQAALRFGASYTACCVHLPSVKRLSREDSERFMNIKLKSLKEQLTDTSPLGGWRNDVWRVTESDFGTNLLVRAGDRMIVETSERLELEVLPSGVSLVDESSMLDELFPGHLRLVIDLPPTMLDRPVNVVFVSGSERRTLALSVERPRAGLYIPALPTS